MVSFLAKTRLGKAEKEWKQKLSFWSFPSWAPIENWKKIAKNIQKTKKTPWSLLFNPKQVGNGRERVTIKIIVPIISYPTRYREFQKIVKKRKKWKKIPLWLVFMQKQVGKGREKVKIKIIVLVISFPTRNRELKIKQKNSKN